MKEAVQVSAQGETRTDDTGVNMDNYDGLRMSTNETAPVESSNWKSETQKSEMGSNVAVIAIHGVGQHLPGASAGAVSTLLMSIAREKVVTDGGENNERTPLYSGFVATTIDVPLRPILAPQEQENEANYRKTSTHWWSRVWRMFDERRGYLAQARENPDVEPYGYSKEELRKGEPDRGEFAYQFMLTQVAGYEGEVDRDFQTVRLEGKRAPSSPTTSVHIYDAHYSDLTKPQGNIVSFFFAFYQLLFHLASLSLLAIYWAEIENNKADSKRRWRWRIKSSVSATAVRLLTMVVPCLNLILLIFGGSAFVQKICFLAAPWPNVIAFSSAGVLGLLATFIVGRRAPSPPRPFLWAAIPFVGPALGVLLLGGLACLYNGALHHKLPLWEPLLLLSWLLSAGFLLAWIASKFEELRPGVFALTVALYIFSLFLFLGYLLPDAIAVLDNGWNAVPTASFWAVQWIFGALSLAWFFCLLSALISWPLGMLCLRGIRREEATTHQKAADKTEAERNDANRKADAIAARRARAVAAFRTGRFAFAMPAILFMIVTTAFWAGIVVYGSDKLKVFDGLELGKVQQGLSSSGKWPRYIIPQIAPVQTWITCASTVGKPDCQRNDVRSGPIAKSDGAKQQPANDADSSCSADEKSDKPGGGAPPSAETSQAQLEKPNEAVWASSTDCSDMPKADKSSPTPDKKVETPPKEPESFWSNYLKGLLLVSVTPGLPITMVLFALSLFLLTWAVLPSIVFEIKPEWTKNAKTHRIRWLGEWLSQGIDNIAILTRVLWLAMVPVPLTFFVIDWVVLRDRDPGWYHYIYDGSAFTVPLITRVGLVLAVSGAAIFGSILKGLTSVLDTILDVDNYLRTSPLDQTPRARIAERCVSLLRYIAARRDDHGQPYYSKVIFVAHSLGSMVTTDLLRYLERSAKSSPDPGLARYEFRGLPNPKCEPRLPIYLFSMGSPLRQLLNRFFPHLYWWVCDVPDNSLSAVGAPVNSPIPSIDTTQLPRSDEMNVKLWTNVYRSGDYIGRSLWLGQWLTRNSKNEPEKPPDASTAAPPQACGEMCVGLGAHTHYWDRSSPDVAEVLDQLIVST